VAALRAALDGASFDGRGLRQLLGDADPRLEAAEQQSLWLWRARGTDGLAALARLFLLQTPIARAEARGALGGDGYSAAGRLGLVLERGGRVHPTVQLSVHGDLRIASDPAARAQDRQYVQGPTSATLLLDRLILPHGPSRVLDLGTGTGLLALRLARGNDAVTATDVSPRALGLTTLNAALNAVPVQARGPGAGRLRPLRSDLYAALARRRFDLIVGNLPFVVGPERRQIFRDSGLDLDGFLADVLGITGLYLEEGCFAQFLGQWIHRDGEDEDERIATWLGGADCDALVWRLERDDVATHAARWSGGPGEVSPAIRRARMDSWMRHLEQRRVTAVSTGLFVLRRRYTDRHFFAVEDAPAGSGLGPGRPVSGADVGARFTTLAASARE
jgi:methylase of polypeptide subunit release factors